MAITNDLFFFYGHPCAGACFLMNSAVPALQFHLNSVQTTLFVGYSHTMQAVPLHKLCFSAIVLDIVVSLLVLLK